MENHRTLREYNIQKGSCLRVINAADARNGIKTFVRSTFPAANAVQVPLDASVVVQLTSMDEDAAHYWGHVLGSPDLETLLPQQVHLREKASCVVVPCRMTLDMCTRKITLTPQHYLSRGKHYQLLLNCPTTDGTRGLRHSKCAQLVEGVLRWSFFTVGYEALRAMHIYPHPWSTVTPARARIAITFSSQLHPQCVERGARDWIAVRSTSTASVAMLHPYYHAPTNTLVYQSSRPLVVGDVVRVRLLAGLVQGAEAQSLLPTQAAGLTKTAPFIWQFYVGDTSRYQEVMLQACGLHHILHRTQGRDAVGPGSPTHGRPGQGPLLANQLPKHSTASEAVVGLEHLEVGQVVTSLTSTSASCSLRRDSKGARRASSTRHTHAQAMSQAMSQGVSGGMSGGMSGGSDSPSSGTTSLFSSVTTTANRAIWGLGLFIHSPLPPASPTAVPTTPNATPNTHEEELMMNASPMRGRIMHHHTPPSLHHHTPPSLHHHTAASAHQQVDSQQVSPATCSKTHCNTAAARLLYAPLSVHPSLSLYAPLSLAHRDHGDGVGGGCTPRVHTDGVGGGCTPHGVGGGCTPGARDGAGGVYRGHAAPDEGGHDAASSDAAAKSLIHHARHVSAPSPPPTLILLSLLFIGALIYVVRWVCR